MTSPEYGRSLNRPETENILAEFKDRSGRRYQLKGTPGHPSIARIYYLERSEPFPKTLLVNVYLESVTKLDEEIVNLWCPPDYLIANAAHSASRQTLYQPSGLNQPRWPVDWIPATIVNAIKDGLNFPFSLTSGQYGRHSHFAVVQRHTNPMGIGSLEAREVRWAWGK